MCCFNFLFFPLGMGASAQIYNYNLTKKDEIELYKRFRKMVDAKSPTSDEFDRNNTRKGRHLLGASVLTPFEEAIANYEFDEAGVHLQDDLQKYLEDTAKEDYSSEVVRYKTFVEAEMHQLSKMFNVLCKDGKAVEKHCDFKYYLIPRPESRLNRAIVIHFKIMNDEKHFKYEARAGLNSMIRRRAGLELNKKWPIAKGKKEIVMVVFCRSKLDLRHTSKI
nr:PREDICTED: uncharacterized protein LOC109039973 isoform X2 [Bemisia tabaci]